MQANPVSDNKTILIVEDEEKIAQILIDYFQANHFTTHWIANGSDVTTWLKGNTANVVLLDIMLPGKDGLQVCREIRDFSNVPIVMITARVEEVDRILGLEIGADDYICKPFSPREVVTRIRALLRRVSFNEKPSTETNLQMDVEKYEARFNQQFLDLTPVEFRLLNTLAGHAGHVFSRHKLIDLVYDDHRIVTDRTMDTHIKNLRKKLQDAGADAEIIRSIYGVGYKYDDTPEETG